MFFRETDWDLGAARIAKAIKENVPSFDHLILVEGIASGGAPSPYPEYDSAYEKVVALFFDNTLKSQFILELYNKTSRNFYFVLRLNHKIPKGMICIC